MRFAFSLLQIFFSSRCYAVTSKKDVFIGRKDAQYDGEVKIGSYICNCMRMNRVFVSCERQPAWYTITVPQDFSRNARTTGCGCWSCVNASRSNSRCAFEGITETLSRLTLQQHAMWKTSDLIRDLVTWIKNVIDNEKLLVPLQEAEKFMLPPKKKSITNYEKLIELLTLSYNTCF